MKRYREEYGSADVITSTCRYIHDLYLIATVSHISSLVPNFILCSQRWHSCDLPLLRINVSICLQSGSTCNVSLLTTINTEICITIILLILLVATRSGWPYPMYYIHLSIDINTTTYEKKPRAREKRPRKMSH